MNPHYSLGHVHLKVRSLTRAVSFYKGLFGLEVSENVGNQYAFLTFGDSHHDLALQEVGAEALTPPRYATGLFHVAFEVPDKRSFAESYQRLREAGVPIAITDHRISWAMYFSDPDGNGLEVYCDTRHEADGDEVWSGQDRPLQRSTLERLLEPHATKTSTKG